MKHAFEIISFCQVYNEFDIEDGDLSKQALCVDEGFWEKLEEEVGILKPLRRRHIHVL
jgi:hypothetical protein